MFFKNCLVYEATKAAYFCTPKLFTIDFDFTFKPCGKTQLKSVGWAPVLPDTDITGIARFFGDNRYMVMCYQSEEKVVVGEDIKRRVAEQVKEIENTQHRRATKAEKEQMKEDIIFSLLPQCQTRVKRIYLYIDFQEDLLVIDSSSRNLGEDICALLRKTLGSLPITSKEMTSHEVMRGWLQDVEKLPEQLSIGCNFTLEGLGHEAGIARLTNEDHNSGFVQQLLNEDRDVNNLALSFDEAIGFVLNDYGDIKKIKFADCIYEQNDDIDSNDVFHKFDADMFLQAEELGRLFDLFGENQVWRNIEKDIIPGCSYEYFKPDKSIVLTNFPEQIEGPTQELEEAEVAHV